jgi:hypothetical protein
MTGRPTLKKMVADALPMVREDQDWQAIQHAILNDYDGLTNSDEDGEYIMEAVRIAEYAVGEHPNKPKAQYAEAMTQCDLEEEKELMLEECNA